MNVNFIDTNIFISYCNPFDIFHNQAIKFINDCSEPIYLITTIREEFIKRIQVSIFNILKVSREYMSLPCTIKKNSFTEILNLNLKRDGLLNFIISLFKKDDSSSDDQIIINYSELQRILIEFPNKLNDCISNLTQSWIEIPNDINIYYRKIYKHYENIIRKYIHYPDVTHLCIGIYESQMKSNLSNNYIFYTNDNFWAEVPLDSFSNFQIELVHFRSS